MNQRKNYQVLILTFIVFLSVSIQLAHANSVYWTGTANDGNWFTAGNWTNSQLPAQDDNVLILKESGDVAVTYSGPTENGPLYKDIYLQSRTGNASLLLNSGKLKAASLSVGGNPVTIGGSGSVVQQHNTVVSSSYIAIGDSCRSGSTIALNTGTYTLNGGKVNSDSISIGAGGDGIFTQNSGDVTTTYLSMGSRIDNLSNNAKYNLNFGNLTTTKSAIGEYGNGKNSSNQINGYFVQNGGTHTTTEMVVGFAAYSKGDYELNGGTLNSGTLILGQGRDPSTGSVSRAEGFFHQVSGTNNVTNDLRLGWEGKGFYDLAGGGLNIGGTLYLGLQPGSYGQMTQTGGILTTGEVEIARLSGITGEYSLSGVDSVLDTNGLSLGYTYQSIIDASRFFQDGGTVKVKNNSSVNGEYILTSGNLNTGGLIVGDDGEGILVQHSGAVRSDSILIGNGNYYSQAKGRYFLHDGTITTGTLALGVLADAEMNQFSGQVSAAVLNVGVYGDQHASVYNLSGGSILSTDQTIWAQGRLNQSGGENSTKTLNLWASDYFLDAGALTVSNELIIGTGTGGTSFLAQSGGSVSVGSNVILGRTLYTTGIYQLTGGTLSVTGVTGETGSGNLVLGGDAVSFANASGTGYFIQNSGVVEIDNNLTIKNNSGYSLSGGSLRVGNALEVSKGQFNQSGGESIVHNLSMSPDGKYILAGGSLTTEYLNSTGAPNSFQFHGGTLTVEKVIGDLKMAGGVLAPGHSPGATTISRDFIMTGGLLDFKIAGLDDYDFLSVSGRATFSTGTLLEFSFLYNYMPSDGDTFRFLDAGSFENFDLLTISVLDLADGLSWSIIEGIDSSTSMSYRSLYFTSNDTVPTPEPSTLILLVSGLLGLGWYGRKRKK